MFKNSPTFISWDIFKKINYSNERSVSFFPLPFCHLNLSQGKSDDLTWRDPKGMASQIPHFEPMGCICLQDDST